jgi:hypothetical protein
MSATMTEPSSGANGTTGVRQEIQDLRKSIDVQTAPQAGANAMAETDAPISESVDGETTPDDDAPSDADKARDEQAKQEESGQENPT